MKKKTWINALSHIFCAAFVTTAMAGVALAVAPEAKVYAETGITATSAVETKKVYLFENGDGTGLTASAGTIESGVWAIPAGGWTTYKLMYADSAQEDLSSLVEKGAKLYVEVEATGTDGSYAEVGIISQADEWDEPYDFYKASLCSVAGYNTVEIALDSFIPTSAQASKTHTTAALLAKFRGVSLKTGKGFNIKNIWFEYTEVSGEVDTTQDVEVLTDAQNSRYVDGTGHVIDVDLSAYSVKPYDTLEIGYTYTPGDTTPRNATISFNGGGTSSVSFGVATAENPTITGTAIVELDAYTEEQLTSVSAWIWKTWSMTSLKIVRGTAPVESNDFALIEASELVTEKLAPGNATTSIADGVISFAAGQGEPTAPVNFTSRMINLATKRLQNALYNDGVITFKYNAPAEGGAENFDLRLMNNGKGDGEYNYTCTPVALTCDGTWREATVKLTDVVRNVVYTTWGGKKDVTLNMDSIVAVGFGLTAGSVELKDFNVSYEDKARTVTGIEVATQPTKTTYFAGDTFDATGMAVNLVFSDDFTLPLYEYTYSTDALVEGDTSVTITYKDYTATVAVTIENPYSSLAITTQPTKKTYYVSEKFDPTGMVVSANLKAGGSEEVSGYTYSTEALTETDTKVTISYMGLTADVTITILPFEQKYTNKLTMFDANSVDEEGELLYGYSIAPTNTPANEVVKTDSETYLKLFSGVTTTADEKQVWNTCVRYTQYEAAYWNIAEIYDDVMDSVVAIKYRTTDTDSVVFGLVNRSEDWNVHYKGVNVALNNDGGWHTAYITLEDLYGEYTHHGWGSDLADYTNFSTIDGFAFMVDASTAIRIDVQSVEICWDGAATAGFRNDIFAPDFEYVGEMTLTAQEGDVAPTFADLTGYDKYEGDVSATIEWAEGAVVDGKLTAGTHIVKIYAQDSKGNKTEAYNVTVNVAANEQENPGDNSGSGDTNSGDNSTDNSSDETATGCFGSISGVSGVVITALLGAVTIRACAKKKKEDK